MPLSNINNEVNINSRAVFVYVYEMFLYDVKTSNIQQDCVKQSRLFNSETQAAHLQNWLCIDVLHETGCFKHLESALLNSNGFKERSRSIAQTSLCLCSLTAHHSVQ